MADSEHNIEEEEDDIPVLSDSTMTALQEFYAEKVKQMNTELQGNAHADSSFEEDWQLSQFWYDEHTAVTLANEALRQCGPTEIIACISCPTVYKKIKQLLKSRPPCDIVESTTKVKLLEYDQRFAIYSDDFVHYDYNSPLVLPDDIVNSCSIVLADPPFLSKECLTKTLQTVRLLVTETSRIILCTGAVMEEDIVNNELNLSPCKFEPKHARNLGNEFKCYANYDFDAHVL